MIVSGSATSSAGNRSRRALASTSAADLQLLLDKSSTSSCWASRLLSAAKRTPARTRRSRRPGSSRAAPTRRRSRPRRAEARAGRAFPVKGIRDAAHVGGRRSAGPRPPPRRAPVAAFGQRHVEEGLAGPVLLRQLRPVRDVAEQLDGVLETACGHLVGDSPEKRPFAGDGQAPAAVSGAQALDHVEQEQWVLLGIEPADAEDADLAVPAPVSACSTGTISFARTSESEIGCTAARPPRNWCASSSPIVTVAVRRATSRKARSSPWATHRPEPQPAGDPVTDVLRVILPDSEQGGRLSATRDQREQDRKRSRAEQPGRVEPLDSPEDPARRGVAATSLPTENTLG